MALVLTRQIDVGGVSTTFYGYPSEPVEGEQTDDRQRNVVVTFTNLAGATITVRLADTLAEVSSLVSSDVNGRLPSFFSSEGGLVMVTDVDAQIRFSPGYVNLAGTATQALAELATARLAVAAAQLAAEEARDAAQAAAAGGTGGSGAGSRFVVYYVNGAWQYGTLAATVTAAGGDPARPFEFSGPADVIPTPDPPAYIRAIDLHTR